LEKWEGGEASGSRCSRSYQAGDVRGVLGGKITKEREKGGDLHAREKLWIRRDKLRSAVFKGGKEAHNFGEKGGGMETRGRTGNEESTLHAREGGKRDNLEETCPDLGGEKPRKGEKEVPKFRPEESVCIDQASSVSGCELLTLTFRRAAVL